MSAEDKQEAGNGAFADGTNRRRRTSALMKAAQTMPTVEASLDDFIARANQTLLDVGGWGISEEQARIEKERAQREARDAEDNRVRDAQLQVRAEADRREAALTRRLIELETKLAEAEAHAALAHQGEDAKGSALAELRARADGAESRARAGEDRIHGLEDKLKAALEKARAAEEKARLADAARAAFAPEGAAPAPSGDDSARVHAAEERVRIDRKSVV
jgi:chromosome segregation ATPase